MRFFAAWIFAWIMFALINIPLYECIDITVKAYIGVTGTVAWFAAMLFDGMLDIVIEIRKNGKG